MEEGQSGVGADGGSNDPGHGRSPMSFVGRLLCVLVVMSFVAGCSSSAMVTMKQQKTGSIPPDRTVAVAVTSPADEDSREAAQELRSELYGRLVSEGVFKHVVAAGEPSDYRMEVQVSGVDRVSQGARIFLGWMAGRNNLSAAVSLHEAGSDRLVTQFDVVAESASHPLSSENEMEDAIHQMVTKIISALR